MNTKLQISDGFSQMSMFLRTRRRSQTAEQFLALVSETDQAWKAVCFLCLRCLVKCKSSKVTHIVQKVRQSLAMFKVSLTFDHLFILSHSLLKMSYYNANTMLQIRVPLVSSLSLSRTAGSHKKSVTLSGNNGVHITTSLSRDFSLVAYTICDISNSVCTCVRSKCR